MSNFAEIWATLSKIDVNKHTEKKGGYTYLSWSWAWSTLMEHYPEAVYEFLSDVHNADGSMEVRVKISIGEHSRFMWLPVMDFKNQAMKNPDGMAINKARMRCLVKCIGIFGLGLYLYSGEDLPQGEDYTQEEKARFDLYFNNEDSLRYFLFMKSLSEEAQTALYNSFGDGKKTAGKKKCNELELNGSKVALEIVSDVDELLANSDISWSSHMEGLEADEKKVLYNMFSEESKKLMHEVKSES